MRPNGPTSRPLSEDDLKRLFEIFRPVPYRIVGVEEGNEVVLTYDSLNTKIKRAQISASKIQSPADL